MVREAGRSTRSEKIEVDCHGSKAVYTTSHDPGYYPTEDPDLIWFYDIRDMVG